jgi:hypothetical protein
VPCAQLLLLLSASPEVGHKHTNTYINISTNNYTRTHACTCTHTYTHIQAKIDAASELSRQKEELHKVEMEIKVSI